MSQIRNEIDMLLAEFRAKSREFTLKRIAENPSYLNEQGVRSKKTLRDIMAQLKAMQ